MNKFTKRASLIAASLGAITAVGVASFAFFTAATSVHAEGNTQTTQTVRVTGAHVEALRPGVCADVTFTLNNDSDGSTVPDLINGGGYVFEGIPANGSRTVTFKNAVCMDLGAGDDAQGQAVTMDLDLIVKQANGGEYTSVN
jgi:hypothetical protein